MNYNQYATAKSYVQTRCAPRAPTNYNYEQFMETFYPERVCLVRTHELQRNDTIRQHGDDGAPHAHP